MLPLTDASRFLRDYVAIPSVNPMGRENMPPEHRGETRYAQKVQKDLQDLGIDSALVGEGERQSVVGIAMATDPAAETLLVASHLDTVPVDSMTISPFDPRIENGRMMGRGTCDTKAGLAALMAALRSVLAKGSLRRNIIVVGEADEELNSLGVDDVLTHLGTRKVDWSVVTEPTEMRMINAHKGTAAVRIKASGRACHSSDPKRGKNAIVSLARAIVSLENLGVCLSQSSHPVLGSATLSVGLVGGGQAPNIVPDSAWIIVDRRTLPGDTADSIRQEIEGQFARDGIADVSIEPLRLGKEPLDTAATQPAAIACHRALRACGCDPHPHSVAFATDAGLFSRHGIPSVVLGPGSIRQAHTDTEYLELDQLETMVGVFEQLFEGC